MGLRKINAPQADSSNESYETSDIEHNKVRTSKYNFFEMKSASRAARTKNVTKKGVLNQHPLGRKL